MPCSSGFHTAPARHRARRQPARRAAAHDAGRGAGAVRVPGRRGRRRRRAARRGVGRTARELVERFVRGNDAGRSASPCSTACCCGPPPGRAEVPSGVRPETAEAMRRLVAADGRRRHPLARRRGRLEPPPPQRAVRRRVRRRPEGDGPGAALRALEAAVRACRTTPTLADDRRRVRLRRPGPHGARVADARRGQPDAVAGRRAAAGHPRRVRRRRPRSGADDSRFRRPVRGSRRMLPAKNFSIDVVAEPARLVVNRPSGSRPPSMCG